MTTCNRKAAGGNARIAAIFPNALKFFRAFRKIYKVSPRKAGWEEKMKIKIKYCGKNSAGEKRYFEKKINSKKELEEFLTFKVNLSSKSGKFLGD